MDSRNPSNPYSDSPSYSHLLHSQNFQYGSYPPSQNFGGGSEIPPFSSQAPEAPAQRENPSVASKERRQRENPSEKTATRSSGMITLARLQLTIPSYSADGSE